MAYVPALRDELRQSAPVLIARSRPASEDIDALAKMILDFLLGYGVKTKEAEEHSAALTLWADALAPLPLDAIRVGMVATSRERILPQPADVYRAAKAYAQELQIVAYRAKRALEYAEEAAPPKRERMSHEEMKAAGFMDENGRIILGQPKTIAATTAAPPPPKDSRAAVAERLRRL